MSMDRKNKKAAQHESKGEKEKELLPQVKDKEADKTSGEKERTTKEKEKPRELDGPKETGAAPVPIRSALSSSLHSQPRLSSSPMREPIGPPSNLAAGSSSAAGFLGRSPAAFGASPNRPSPLSNSFSARLAAPSSSLSLKGHATTSTVPATTGGSGFSSSFSHSSLSLEHPSAPPLSASFADGASSANLQRNIWARSAATAESLSPRRMIPAVRHPDVFEDDDEGDIVTEQQHGEDLIPSSLTELLTPREMARRLSRRDSNESYGSPRRVSPGILPPGQMWGGERLAQSAGAAMGAGFLGSLWAANGSDARKGGPGESGFGADGVGAGTGAGDMKFAPTAPAAPKSSLLSQRAPISPLRNTTGPGTGYGLEDGGDPSGALSNGDAGATGGGGGGGLLFGTIPSDKISPAPAYFNRATDPSSPSARALQEHAPGMSLPGGVAGALSRLHMRDAPYPQGGAGAQQSAAGNKQAGPTPPRYGLGTDREHTAGHGHGQDEEEGMFDMDG